MITSNSAEGPHTVRLSKSDRELVWTGSCGTLLEFLEDAGVPVESSCRTGICGTCETRLFEGEVAYDPGPFIDAAADAVFLCCARPQSHIVIEL